MIIGCGGFGRELADVIDAINGAQAESEQWNLIGFLDDSPCEEDVRLVAQLGLSLLGAVDDSTLDTVKTARYAIGISSSSTRRAIASIVERVGMRPATLIHPSAILGRSVRVGDGSIIGAQAHVTTNVEVGRYVHIDRGSQIGHDSSLGDFSTIHPMAVVSGNCHIGSGTELGTNCTILPGVIVGSDCIVGASACAVHDVPSRMTVKGVPAR